MTCPYIENAFCAQLPESTRQQLCASCKIKHYQSGQVLTYEYFNKSPALVLDGLFVDREMAAAPNGKAITVGLASTGDVISTGNLDAEFIKTGGAHELVCAVDSAVALFDEATSEHLYETDIPFIKTLLLSCLRFCGLDTPEMIKEINAKDAYSSVRYIVRYCTHRDIPVPTHEQIAMLCNHSRPTVTEEMHKLLQNEPEIFKPVHISSQC